jgi:hypothetical protein
MTTKQKLLVSILFVSANIFSKDFVFDRRMYTQIKGNYIASYLFDRSQDNPSYVFKHTRVIECSKDKKLKQIGTLGSLAKESELASYGGAKKAVNRFTKFAEMNNAIYCSDVEQHLNYFDKLEDVGAIIYGTQDINDCELFRKYLAEEKAAEDSAKLQNQLTEDQVK